MSGASAGRLWRIGIIGATGRYARRRCLPPLSQLPNARLVAVAARQAERLQEVAREFGVPRTYLNPQDLLADPEVDAVIITTPNYLHYPLVLQALAAGKHVLCEKPLALTLAEAAEMERVRAAKGLVGMVGFRFRYLPAARLMAQLIQQGELGRLLHARFWCWQDWAVDGCPYLANPSMQWRLSRQLSGAGVLGDIGAHLFDLARWWLGEVHGLQGRTGLFSPTRRVGGAEGAAPQSLAVDNDDWFVAQATFGDGIPASFEASRVVPGVGLEMGMEVVGERATARIVPGQNDVVWLAGWGQAFAARPAPDSGTDVDRAFMAGFLRLLDEGGGSPSFADGVRCQAMIEAVERSSAEGRWLPV